VTPRTDLVDKGPAVEEWTDLHFFRPAGLWLTRLLQPTRVTADQVSIAGMAIGLVAGHLFLYERRWLNLLGLLLFIFSDVCDSADGQLARLRGSSTRLGRILDGISDNVRFVGLYLHLGVRLLLRGVHPVSVVSLVLLTAGSHSLQGSVADFLRQVFLFLSGGKAELDLPEDLLEPAGSNWLDRFRLWIYRGYVGRQVWLLPASTAVVRTARREGLSAGLSRKWREAQGGWMERLALIGTNIRFPLLACAIWSGWVRSFLWATIVPLNLALAWILIGHEREARVLARTAEEPAMVLAGGG